MVDALAVDKLRTIGAAETQPRSPPKRQPADPLASAVLEEQENNCLPLGESNKERPAVGARGRDNAVLLQLTKTKMCAFFERGKCASSTCRYAHTADELRRPPNLQKTKLCRKGLLAGWLPCGRELWFRAWRK